jgi:transposase-like protein
MARQQRNLSLERTWRRRFREQRASSKSVREFCVEHHLTESNFYFWRKTIAERDRQNKAKSSTAFVPVTVIESPAQHDGTPIDIHLSNGRRLRVRSGCDRELLAVILALLEKPSC